MQNYLILGSSDLKYKSPSQQIRVLSETWVSRNIYCPSCGKMLDRYPNNKPVADFFCSMCSEDYELKSKCNRIGSKIVDGAYKTMIDRLEHYQNPNLFLLSYSLPSYNVRDYLVIPKCFFISDIIEKRKPLSTSARRRGWVGCNIILSGVPNTGKIFYIKQGQLLPKAQVLDNWQRVSFLKQEKLETKGWLIDIMGCIDKIGKKEFILDDLYSCEKELKIKHPNNRHIRDKIRQQLQILRNKGYLNFVGRGKYKIG